MSTRYSIKLEEREGITVFSLNDADSARAEIAPSLGNNCFAFHLREPILEPISFADFRHKPTSYGIPLLFPFPNRIRDGKFSFQGKRYEVNPSRHGFVRDKEWQVLDYGASDAEGAWLTSRFDATVYSELILKQYPFPFQLDVTYRLRAGALELLATARNTGERDMPTGFGIHPYFRRPARGTLTVPAGLRWELSDSLPTGELAAVSTEYDLRLPRDLSGLQLDDIFTGVSADDDGLIRCVLTDEEAATQTLVEFRAEHFQHVVVFTPLAPRQAICIEPNTCPTDAFNLQEQGIECHLIVLRPGEEKHLEVRIHQRDLEQTST